MIEAMKINNLKQIKMMAHPLRMKLLEAFSHGPITTKQIAKLLEENPTRLYHHVDGLEQVGLIKLVKTRKKRGTLEKYYQTVAQAFTIDRRLFKVLPHAGAALNNVHTMFTNILEETLSEVYRNIEEYPHTRRDKKKRVILSHARIRATPEQILILEKKINGLLKKYESIEQQTSAAEYGFTLVFYPVGKKSKRRRHRTIIKRRT